MLPTLPSSPPNSNLAILKALLSKAFKQYESFKKLMQTDQKVNYSFFYMNRFLGTGRCNLNFKHINQFQFRFFDHIPIISSKSEGMHY